MQLPASPNPALIAEPVLATSPHVPLLVGGYRLHDRFYFADDELAEIARHSTGPRLVRTRSGWQESHATQPPTVLPRTTIAGQPHHLLSEHWAWTSHRIRPAQHPGRGAPTRAATHG